jgi:hypothetical protein
LVVGEDSLLTLQIDKIDKESGGLAKAGDGTIHDPEAPGEGGGGSPRPAQDGAGGAAAELFSSATMQPLVISGDDGVNGSPPTTPGPTTTAERREVMGGPADELDPSSGEDGSEDDDSRPGAEVPGWRVGWRRGRSDLLIASGQLVESVYRLVEEIKGLRQANEALQEELRVARLGSNLPMIQRPGRPPGKARAGTGRRGRPRRAAAHPSGRATPPEVTETVVRAVLSKLGEPTAAEMAAEITRAGTRVSGQALRFLAEKVGASSFVDAQGSRRYRL